MEQNLIKSEIKSRIFSIRGKQVMFDRDLARLYNVQTRVLNQAVKRNANRFPEQFMFQLNSEEFDNWKSQIVTSNSEKMGLRKLPYVFTEYGVAMLSGVLNSETALNINIEIIQTFIDSRNTPKHSPSLQKRVNEIETRLIHQENKFNDIFNFITENKFPQSGIFFQNQIFDAYVFSSELISKARKSIILIDNYINETTLLQLSKRNKKVSCVIYTEKITAQLKLDLEKHNAQYTPIEIRILKNSHDRFIILDEKELYHIGASLKDLGKRWFAFSKMDGLMSQILSHLHD